MREEEPFRPRNQRQTFKFDPGDMSASQIRRDAQDYLIGLWLQTLYAIRELPEIADDDRIPAQLH